MAKICFFDTGSTVSAQNIPSDVLADPELADRKIASFDIGAERLSISEIFARPISSMRGRTDLRIAAATNRPEVLQAADFDILMFRIGNCEPSTAIHCESSTLFGLRQAIVDTLSLTGIFRALRPVCDALIAARGNYLEVYS
jgi:alpha-galactosidase/6-phospho-beta-glucosidase family protein